MKIPISIFASLMYFNSYCQRHTGNFISADSALRIAVHQQHFFAPKNIHSGWTATTAQLDSIRGIWQITSSKTRFRHWGRTTKNFDTDARKPCRRVNGCRVCKTKTMCINATTGKLLDLKKDKRIFGNYE